MSNQQGAKINVYWYVARERSLAMADGYHTVKQEFPISTLR